MFIDVIINIHANQNLTWTSIYVFHYWTLFYRHARESDNPCIIAATLWIPAHARMTRNACTFRRIQNRR